MKAIDVFATVEAPSVARRTFERTLALREMRQIEGPALFLSREMARRQIRALAKALPEVGIYYAMKSNDHPSILSLVVEEGHSFDVCSIKEIEKCVDSGADAATLLHTHPIKADYEISAAFAAGVRIFVVDNVDEIAKFEAYGDRVQLMVRFRALVSEEVEDLVQCDLSYKFGCAPREIPNLVSEIRSRGIGYAGLAFHVGSQCQSPAPYLKAVNLASDAIIALNAAGIRTEILDIGGGFPVEYLTPAPNIEEFCRPIRQAIASVIPQGVKIICEPGRFISAPAATLVANVVGKSLRGGKTWYYLDDGVYGSFSGRLYDHCAYQALTNRNTTWSHCVLAGPTCDSVDIIYENILLPPLEIGDALVFPAMGAYCAVSASDFNSLRKAQVIVID